MKKMAVILLSGLSFSVHATLTPLLAGRGERKVEHAVPGRAAEVCIIPKHLDLGKYSDKDLSNESKLCALDFNVNSVACAKLNSTNPGLDIFALPGGCNSAGGKLAKYKLSTSCSYAPSILGYYHLSRILGNVANVPVSVLRTVDLKNHLAIGAKALSQTKAGSLIQQTWSGLVSNLRAGASSSKRDQLMTDDFTQSYGALSKNPGKEAFYKEFFNGGADGPVRAVNFRDRNPTMALLSQQAEISRVVGREFNPVNVQKMVQIKDASEMIILDTIMNQQDRFGNIHYVERHYYFDPQDGKLKDESLAADEAAKLGAVKVKQMILKDNDCGVTKTNIAAGAKLSLKIAHLDPKTYKRLQRLNALADQPAVKQLFNQELMFTARDFASVRENLRKLAVELHDRCVAGKLKLDLDLESHFSNGPLKAQSCELEE